VVGPSSVVDRVVVDRVWDDPVVVDHVSVTRGIGYLVVSRTVGIGYLVVSRTVGTSTVGTSRVGNCGVGNVVVTGALLNRAVVDGVFRGAVAVVAVPPVVAAVADPAQQHVHQRIRGAAAGSWYRPGR